MDKELLSNYYYESFIMLIICNSTIYYVDFVHLFIFWQDLCIF